MKRWTCAVSIAGLLAVSLPSHSHADGGQVPSQSPFAALDSGSIKLGEAPSERQQALTGAVLAMLDARLTQLADNFNRHHNDTEYLAGLLRDAQTPEAEIQKMEAFLKRTPSRGHAEVIGHELGIELGPNLLSISPSDYLAHAVRVNGQRFLWQQKLGFDKNFEAFRKLAIGTILDQAPAAHHALNWMDWVIPSAHAVETPNGVDNPKGDGHKIHLLFADNLVLTLLSPNVGTDSGSQNYTLLSGVLDVQFKYCQAHKEEGIGGSAAAVDKEVPQIQSAEAAKAKNDVVFDKCNDLYDANVLSKQGTIKEKYEACDILQPKIAQLISCMKIAHDNFLRKTETASNSRKGSTESTTRTASGTGNSIKAFDPGINRKGAI